MSYATRRRRHDLTLGDKREIIRLIDNRTSQTDVAKIYNCSQSQISRIVSKRDDILTDYENCDDPAQKRCRINTRDAEHLPTKTKRGGETTHTVVDQSTSPRRPDNALDASQQTSGSANNGWLEYWKNHSSQFGHRSYRNRDRDYTPWSRHYGSGSVVKRMGRGRPKASANKESRISNQLLDILKNYDLCDVYCADELALHYDAMPNLDGSNAEDADDGDGEKRVDRAVGDSSKKQITLLLTCNVTGSDKRDFLVIEDSKRSDVDPTAVDIPGCHRARAPHAWMTSDVYKEYLLAFDYDLRRQRRYILLLVDNAPPHVPEAGKGLEHIRVLYVRSYATPFFHGLFYSVRAHYRKQILLRLFAKNQESNVAGSTSSGRSTKKSRRERISADMSLINVDFQDAVSMLKQAWQSIAPQDIVQCFSKAGICAPHIHGLPENTGDNLPELPEGFVTDEQYEEFVNVDVDAECTGDADMVSAECRILSDLRNQGFMDVGLEPSDDLPPDFVGLASSGMAKTSGDKKFSTGMNTSYGHSQSLDLDDSTEVHGALLAVRNFLTRRGLHLHNLHALEAQIFSCDSGGPKG